MIGERGKKKLPVNSVAIIFDISSRRPEPMGNILYNQLKAFFVIFYFVACISGACLAHAM